MTGFLSVEGEFEKNLDLFVEQDHEDMVTIHFGDVPNKQVDQICEWIEKALKAHLQTGKADILKTEGRYRTLLSVMVFSGEFWETEELEINYV